MAKIRSIYMRKPPILGGLSVEARYSEILPRPERDPVENSGANRDLSEYDLSQLPVVSVDCRDVLSERIHIGKAVLKGMFFAE